MPTFSLPSLENIREAHTAIQPFIHRTPVMSSSAINIMAGCSIFFKCENLQKVGAFKARGAANAVRKLSDSQKLKGVATHSSGNHAAALARAAQVAGIPAYIVMPKTAPEIKKAAVASYGGEIIECEPTQQAREEMLGKVVEKTGATFIHPYDFMDVIEGQATAALELIEDVEGLDVIITPVGGGGLLAGTLLTAGYMNPSLEVYAGEPQGADDAFRSLQTGERQPSLKPNTIADGLLTSLGEINFAIIQGRIKEIITVSDEEIKAAMKLILERMKIVIEPSSAVPLAAILKEKETFAGKNVGVILTGGNVDLGI
ncbi:pyridoxal-phosphate dependent enzyme [Litoribacter alkaliphilus]|uniref:Pyridoxal-phosphate dependent enzyme n=1 Tax=Litoribacter ruber TaxID=702568 RepID=A0AAP2G0W4_9BACT|nr:pyridoxal-phosphate dependent enzyme [Litoribacter alkaliphilus]MBS9523579.1 pyridoxal-phosphate dependent enzyme [Litoribacter alkaliphilus]